MCPVSALHRWQLATGLVPEWWLRSRLEMSHRSGLGGCGSLRSPLCAEVPGTTMLSSGLPTSISSVVLTKSQSAFPLSHGISFAWKAKRRGKGRFSTAEEWKLLANPAFEILGIVRNQKRSQNCRVNVCLVAQLRQKVRDTTNAVRRSTMACMQADVPETTTSNDCCNPTASTKLCRVKSSSRLSQSQVLGPTVRPSCQPKSPTLQQSRTPPWSAPGLIGGPMSLGACA